MSNSTRTDTLIMQAIRGVKRYRRGSAKTRHNHIKEARRFVYHSLKTWIQKYYRVILDKGISKKECGASSHGCRHAYAQDRYEEITGFKAPCKFESKEKYRKNAIKIAGEGWRKLNQDARQIIKAELGHGPDRDDVVSQYLGAI